MSNFYEDNSNMIKSHIKQIRRELALYNNERDEVILMEAAEKIWTSYGFLLNNIENEVVAGHKEKVFISKDLIKNDQQFRRLYDLADQLHRYHYGGGTVPSLIISKINEAIRLLDIENRKIMLKLMRNGVNGNS